MPSSNNNTTPTSLRSKRKSIVSLSSLSLVISFLLGCILSTTIVLNAKFASLHPHPSEQKQHPLVQAVHKNNKETTSQQQQQQQSHSAAVAVGSSPRPKSVLEGLRILVAIASYDFSQIPHIEEVLDGYFDVCAGGPAQVHVIIHTTVAYPVTLIDLLNSRFFQGSTTTGLCQFTLTIILKSPIVKLHLVDFHRTMFYDKIDEYDLFIYSEDDIRVTPKTIAAYVSETERVKQITSSSNQHKPSDFNVGIVRYEYNFPPDIIINDKTRHATKDVTRVYWEHGWKPPIPKSVDVVPQAPLSQNYVHMQNHHQGMYLATRDLLLAWKDRGPNCQFDKVRDRPGLKHRPSQPSEGTQRVWMSSTMLYGGRHCNVQQVLPMANFGQLTVLHLPNKNYRRVGKKGRLGGHQNNGTKVEFADGTEQYELPSPQLLTAMELHLELRKRWPVKPQQPYNGIQMVDEVGGRGRTPLLERRMAEYHDYVARGGVMTEEDMTKTSLFE